MSSAMPSATALPHAFTTPLGQSPLRAAITALARAPEPALLPGLLAEARLDPAQAEAANALALRIAAGVRARSHGSGTAGLVQGLLQEFALSSQEGVALMCLAEALLRIPDLPTRDALIRDKIGDGQGVDWERHLGHSPSVFVNAAAWGLLLTGKQVRDPVRQRAGLACAGAGDHQQRARVDAAAGPRLAVGGRGALRGVQRRVDVDRSHGRATIGRACMDIQSSAACRIAGILINGGTGRRWASSTCWAWPGASRSRSRWCT